MTKALQSLPFRIADREARIADLEADNTALRQEVEEWKAHAARGAALALDLQQAVNERDAQLTALRQQLAEAVGALEEVEFVADYEGTAWCPWCLQSEAYGHADDCRRQSVLSKAQARP